MRTCAFCGEDCDSSLGLARELKTVWWGGKKHGSVEYSPKAVSFYCSEEHRNQGEALGVIGEVQRREDIGE